MGCGAGIPGLIYCLSFFLFVNLIFLNLFIAIVLQGFADTMEKEQRLFNQDILGQFSEIWSEFDPDATSFIPIASLRPFLKRLGEPMGFDFIEAHSRTLQDRFISSLELPTYNDFSKYQFRDVLDAISLRMMIIDHVSKDIGQKKPEKPDEAEEAKDKDSSL